jgi:hypothetical protein
VVKSFCRIRTIDRAVRKLFHFVREIRIRVTVNDRYLIPLGVPICNIIRIPINPIVVACLSPIEDTGILHLEIRRRLKIYVLRYLLEESLKLSSWFSH